MKPTKNWILGVEQHLLLWSNVRDRKPLIAHFETHIRPLLE